MLARTPDHHGIPPHLIDYAREIERIINSVALPVVGAELADGSVAEWLLVRVQDSHRATRHLSRRRFAVFWPSGVFPAGYLFVYAFDAAKMLERIKACPGVDGVICAVSDAFVLELKARYYSHAPRSHATVIGDRTYSRKKPKAKRTSKAERKALSKLRKVLKKMHYSDSSTLEAARRLEPHERIALLENTVQTLHRARQADAESEVGNEVAP